MADEKNILVEPNIFLLFGLMETQGTPKIKAMTSGAACARCRWQRKKCSDHCVLAPHFPSSDPDKFAAVHRVFGTSKVMKTLEGVPREQRADAVKHMVYEATARVKDPVHGCSNVVNQLRQQIVWLESQLATAHREVMIMRLKRDKLVAHLINGSDHGDVEHASYAIGGPSHKN